MILSRRHGFVFIKARKVGGTSVETALSLLCDGEQDIVTPITPVDERARLAMGGRPRNFAKTRADEIAYMEAIEKAPDAELDEVRPQNKLFHNHMTVRGLLKRISLDGLTKVGVVRSPYGRVVSAANHRVGFKEYRRTGERMIATHDQIRAAVDRMIKRDQLKTKLLSDVYRDDSGKVDIRQLRQEHLEEDLAAFLSSLGVDHPPALPRAKEGLGLSAIEAFEILRPDQRATIAGAFAEDIENFGDGLS